MGGCMATHLINLVVDPIPANQRLDVAPDQEGGKNQEDEEPGEQESQAHAAERGRGGAGDGFADPNGQEGACPSSCSPAAPSRARARRAGQGPGRGVCRAAGAASSQGGAASPKPAGAGGGFKSFSSGTAPSPSLGFAWGVFLGGVRWKSPPQPPGRRLHQEKLGASFSSALVVAGVLPLGKPVSPQGHPRHVAGEDEEDDGAQHRARDPPGGNSSRAHPRDVGLRHLELSALLCCTPCAPPCPQCHLYRSKRSTSRRYGWLRSSAFSSALLTGRV